MLVRYNLARDHTVGDHVTCGAERNLSLLRTSWAQPDHRGQLDLPDSKAWDLSVATQIADDPLEWRLHEQDTELLLCSKADDASSPQPSRTPNCAGHLSAPY